MSEIDSKTGILYVDETSWIVIAYVLVGAFIIYLAWCSTNVRNDTRGNLYRQRTVFIFNPQTGDFQQQHSVDRIDLNAHWNTPPPTLESILDEVNGITSGGTYHIQRQEDTFDSDLMDDDAQEIIREMDHEPQDNENDNDFEYGIWHRRGGGGRGDQHNSARDDANNDATTTNARSRASSSTPTDEPQIYPVIDEVPTNVDVVTSDNNDEHHIDSSSSCSSSRNSNRSTPMDSHERIAVTPPIASGSTNTNNCAAFGDELTIKLKYLNDDLKIVKARPNEPIGDFKKRNFNEELSAQKLVRLVFNGHVLQPDSKTITACGLFDNCVVHCLIHNSRPNAVPPPNQSNDGNQSNPAINEDGNEQIGIENLINANRNRNRNTQRLLNLSLFLICLSVIISWFFRIQYFQLFTWYSTVGLVLLTTFFVVIIPLIFLIEREIFRNL